MSIESDNGVPKVPQETSEKSQDNLASEMLALVTSLNGIDVQARKNIFQRFTEGPGTMAEADIPEALRLEIVALENKYGREQVLETAEVMGMVGRGQ